MPLKTILKMLLAFSATTLFYFIGTECILGRLPFRSLAIYYSIQNYNNLVNQKLDEAKQASTSNPVTVTFKDHNAKYRWVTYAKGEAVKETSWLGPIAATEQEAADKATKTQPGTSIWNVADRNSSYSVASFELWVLWAIGGMFYSIGFLFNIKAYAIWRDRNANTEIRQQDYQT